MGSGKGGGTQRPIGADLRRVKVCQVTLLRWKILLCVSVSLCVCVCVCVVKRKKQ